MKNNILHDEDTRFLGGGNLEGSIRVLQKCSSDGVYPRQLGGSC